MERSKFLIVIFISCSHFLGLQASESERLSELQDLKALLSMHERSQQNEVDQAREEAEFNLMMNFLRGDYGPDFSGAGLDIDLFEAGNDENSQGAAAAYDPEKDSFDVGGVFDPFNESFDDSEAMPQRETTIRWSPDVKDVNEYNRNPEISRTHQNKNKRELSPEELIRDAEMLQEKEDEAFARAGDDEEAIALFVDSLSRSPRARGNLKDIREALLPRALPEKVVYQPRAERMPQQPLQLRPRARRGRFTSSLGAFSEE